MQRCSSFTFCLFFLYLLQTLDNGRRIGKLNVVFYPYTFDQCNPLISYNLSAVRVGKAMSWFTAFLPPSGVAEAMSCSFTYTLISCLCICSFGQCTDYGLVDRMAIVLYAEWVWRTGQRSSFGYDVYQLLVEPFFGCYCFILISGCFSHFYIHHWSFR